MIRVGGEFDNNGKLTKPLKYLVNWDGIFEHDTQFEPLDDLYVANTVQ